jgi:hypothetical protein
MHCSWSARAQVSKLGGTVSKLAVATAQKYELTPTPVKVKRA